MALKDILVHVDNGASCKNRIDIAINLALAHDAHLTGLFVVARPQVPPFVQAYIGNDILETQYKALLGQAAQHEKEFRDLCARSGVKYEWRSVEGDVNEEMVLQARYADLSIIGQVNRDEEATAGGEELPDRLVLMAGRPVLVVPYVGNFSKMGERILVAWDASRLSTRAVNDAMPFMVKAKKVEVLAVNPKGGQEGHGEMVGADICLHLARHGVKAEAQHVVADDMDAGNMLLSRAADEGIDLIVMGAYGHRRLRELVLGGVTRHMLNHMTVPVLMSH